MLTSTPNKDELFAAIAEEIRSLPDVEEGQLEGMTADSELNAHLGLSSLQMAELVVALEMRFSVDPFSSLVPITDVRTVGDLVAAYERALRGTDGAKDGEGEPEPANETLLAAQRRAMARRRR